jgi:hypothetical protein
MAPDNIWRIDGDWLTPGELWMPWHTTCATKNELDNDLAEMRDNAERYRNMTVTRYAKIETTKPMEEE